MKPSEPDANTTRSSRKPAGRSQHGTRWSRNWLRNGKPNKTCSPLKTRSQSGSPRENWHGRRSQSPTSGAVFHGSATARQRFHGHDPPQDKV
jgi:hypothetical protein